MRTQQGTVSVSARRWAQGWELWISGEPATQADNLDDAAEQVRDYLDTIDPGTDHGAWEVRVTAQPDGQGSA